MIDYLSLEDVVAIHAEVARRSQIEPASLVDPDGLSAELRRPEAEAYYEHADLVRQAAVLAVGIAHLQPFARASYETAYMAMGVFLELNGWEVVEEGDVLIALVQKLRWLAEEHNRPEAVAQFEIQLRKAARPHSD